MGNAQYGRQVCSYVSKGSEEVWLCDHRARTASLTYSSIRSLELTMASQMTQHTRGAVKSHTSYSIITSSPFGFFHINNLHYLREPGRKMETIKQKTKECTDNKWKHLILACASASRIKDSS